MKEKRFKELLNNSFFLSLFYQARNISEEYKLPLEASFMATGLNKYKTWFTHLCDEWGLENLLEVNEFDMKIKNYNGID